MGPTLERAKIAVLMMLLGAPLLACQRDAAANQTATKESGSVSPEAPTAATVTKSHFDEAQFTLTIAQNGQASRGQPAELVIALAAKPPYHVNREYPHRFKVTATRGLTTATNVVQRDLSRVTSTKLELVVPVAVGQDAPFGIDGEMSFSLCTDEKCLMEKRQLSTVLVAK